MSVSCLPKNALALLGLLAVSDLIFLRLRRKAVTRDPISKSRQRRVLRARPGAELGQVVQAH